MLPLRFAERSLNMEVNSLYYGYETLVKYDSLEHHGIKGQKWGTRRFQEKDGRLTRLGKERYSHKYDKFGFMNAGSGEHSYGKSEEIRPNYTSNKTGEPLYVDSLKTAYEHMSPKERKEYGITSSNKMFITSGMLDDIVYDEMSEQLNMLDANNKYEHVKDSDEKLKAKYKRSFDRAVRNYEATVELAESWFDYYDAYSNNKLKSTLKNFKEDWSVGASSIASAGKNFVSGLFGKKKKKG